jgi:hypothetical protein
VEILLTKDKNSSPDVQKNKRRGKNEVIKSQGMIVAYSSNTSYQFNCSIRAWYQSFERRLILFRSLFGAQMTESFFRIASIVSGNDEAIKATGSRCVSHAAEPPLLMGKYKYSILQYFEQSELIFSLTGQVKTCRFAESFLSIKVSFMRRRFLLVARRKKVICEYQVLICKNFEFFQLASTQRQTLLCKQRFRLKFDL